MGLGKYIKKQGVDKNGHQYTRLVRPEGSSENERRLPTGAVLSQYEPGQFEDYLETSDSVLKSIPESERLQVTPEQLDKIFGVMTRFGTDDADSYGFRRHIAKRSSFNNYEWTERHVQSRYNQSVGADGRIYDASLYSSGYGDADDPKFYEGQAEIREALGLERYKPSEVTYLAGRYWDSHILHSLGEIPREGANQLRRQYIADIAAQPHIVDEIVESLKEQPLDKIGDVRTYMEALVQTDQEDHTEFINLVEQGKTQAARNRLEKFKFVNRIQKASLYAKLREPKKKSS